MKKSILLIALFISSLSLAQKNDVGNWFLYFGNLPINDKWNVWSEGQFRNYDIGDVQQVLLRTGVGYNLTPKNNNILLGYGFIYTENYNENSTEKNDMKEHRIYQQFIHKNKISRLQLQHRFRLEERFIEQDFKMRGRYLLGLNIPINRTNMEPKTFYISAYNEIFLNLQDKAFGINRIYGVLGYQFHKNLKVEMGFMNQSTSKQGRNQVQIGIYNTLPL